MTRKLRRVSTIDVKPQTPSPSWEEAEQNWIALNIRNGRKHERL